MELTTVLFDMDGLLIDSEPLWNEAANDVFISYGIQLTEDQYKSSTGLRTKEFIQLWFRHFNIDESESLSATERIHSSVIKKIADKGKPMPGVSHIIKLFERKQFKTGIASSSPVELIELVMDICDIRKYIQAITSAEHLPYGKPHPQVYLNCAALLGSDPLECICFEDSFYGMIAALAGRMKCVAVPHRSEANDPKWRAANLKISTLQNFNLQHLNLL